MATRINDLDAFVIDGILTPEQSAQWISAATAAGFENNGDKTVFAGNRQRVVIHDQQAADTIYGMLKSHLRHRDVTAGTLASMSGPLANKLPYGRYEPVGLSDMFRISKYVTGQDFPSHVDTVYARDDQYVGMHTILIYLSECDGGETRLLNGNVYHDIKPFPGRALVFYHHSVHAGLPVIKGVKYIARTEVMYRLGVPTPISPAIDL